eukprot:TRINITY_DN5420_c0_g1_i1.p1 TRINITY_DN5420_c0_g1~~TRINITY_DN5420_c0_g1_i1.p1  ORF type:complete len:355 (+),score=40.60 TRINITY_DN5420_c0_g1_i1:95-1066(+)
MTAAFATIAVTLSSFGIGAVSMQVGKRSDGASVSGLKLQSLASPSTSSAALPMVCISLCASEEAPWIDALLQNALAFTERSTHLALHLDANTHYDSERLDAWNKTVRVTLAQERVPVRRFHGSILYGHLLNARALPEACEFVVLQASNMLWVRRGMEAAVREARIGGPTPFSGPRAARNLVHSFFADEIMAGKPTMSWGTHEGSFYPALTLRAFDHSLTQWIRRNGSTIQEAILDQPLRMEEFWLQTYVANREEPDTFFAPGLTYMDIRTRGGVPASTVEKVQRGEMPPGYNPKRFGAHGLFAVKRIERNLSNPVTQMILAMS